MLSRNKMDAVQMNRCVKQYSFLSPRLNSSFPNCSQKTECDLSSRSSSIPSDDRVGNQSSSIKPFLLSRLFLKWKALCEESVPSATDRMERAKESLKTRKHQESILSGLVSEMEVQNYLAQETGKNRLFKMFTRDNTGHSSPEFQFIYQVTLQAGAGTFLVMTTLAGRQAKQDFIDRNRATVFKTRFQAFRRLQDAVFLFSMKEGAKWAFRVSLFSLCFLGISQSIAVYRNKSTAWEYGVAAGVTMGLLKASMGLKAFVISTGLGCVLGSMMGFVVLGAMKAMNETQEQRHYWQIHKELERERMFELKGKLPDSSPAETAAVETA